MTAKVLPSAEEGDGCDDCVPVCADCGCDESPGCKQCTCHMPACAHADCRRPCDAVGATYCAACRREDADEARVDVLRDQIPREGTP